MINLIDGWIDLSKVMDASTLDLSLDNTAEHPDECALSAIAVGGSILRTIADKRPDDATVQDLIANLMEMQEEGGEIGGLELSPEALATTVFDQDTALRYIRLLIHNSVVCLDYTPAAYVGRLERADIANREGTKAGREIAYEAAQLASQSLSPYGVMMTMFGAAWQHALMSGISPLQIMQGLTKHAQLVLMNIPVTHRAEEDDSDFSMPDVHLLEQFRLLPNIEGSFRFFKAMGWMMKPIDPDMMAGIAPCLALEPHGTGTVAAFAVGYLPLQEEEEEDGEEDHALKVRSTIASLCATRNMDALTISKCPVSVGEDTRYTVIGDAYVRQGDSPERVWRPAVVWRGCKGIGAVIDLARSPFFGFSEPAYAYPNGDITKLIANSMFSA